MATALHMRDASQAAMRTAGGVELLAGIWLLAAPYVLDYSATGGSMVNDSVSGIIALALGLTQMRSDGRQMLPTWLSGLLGLWLLAAPFVLGYPSGSPAMWSDIVTGIVLAGLAVANSMAMPEPMEEDR